MLADSMTDGLAKWILESLSDGPLFAFHMKSVATQAGFEERMFTRAVRKLVNANLIESLSTPQPGKPAARTYQLKGE